jgi:hypothetical protein
MLRDVLVYISGPITAKGDRTVDQNVADAAAVYLRLIERGIPAFCPHLSALVPEAFDIAYETWIAYDMALIDRCTHLLMLPHWELSNGALLERAYAREDGKPIAYSEDELIEMIANRHAQTT